MVQCLRGEYLLASAVVDQAYNEKFDKPLDASQELLGVGITNTLAGLFQGFPVGGSFGRYILS